MHFLNTWCLLPGGVFFICQMTLAQPCVFKAKSTKKQTGNCIGTSETPFFFFLNWLFCFLAIGQRTSCFPRNTPNVSIGNFSLKPSVSPDKKLLVFCVDVGTLFLPFCAGQRWREPTVLPPLPFCATWGLRIPFPLSSSVSFCPGRYICDSSSTLFKATMILLKFSVS